LQLDDREESEEPQLIEDSVAGKKQAGDKWSEVPKYFLFN